LSNTRIIARLDIKGANLIKGISFEGLRVVGDPNEYALRYYQEGIDEVIFIDAVASLYRRNNLKEIVRRTVNEVFVPITVGGGIRSVDDAREILSNGADKVAVNTAAIWRPELISEIANKFGSQCLVLSVHAKRDNKGSWEALVDYGREHTNRDVIDWIKEGVSLGAGEVLLTSVDRDGTLKGFDIDLLKSVSSETKIPLIVSGGCGNPEHMVEAIEIGNVDAVAIASCLHFGKSSLKEIQTSLLKSNIQIAEH
jgi:imidazole glycerol-phosphate synthase subunit HisF